jgi:hypothetical protein
MAVSREAKRNASISAQNSAWAAAPTIETYKPNYIKCDFAIPNSLHHKHIKTYAI